VNSAGKITKPGLFLDFSVSFKVTWVPSKVEQLFENFSVLSEKARSVPACLTMV